MLKFSKNSDIVAKFNNWFTQDNVFLQGLIWTCFHFRSRSVFNTCCNQSL